MSEPVRVTRGHPSDEELAAAIAVVSAATRPREALPDADASQVGGWAAYYRTLRQPIRYGRNAWRASVR